MTGLADANNVKQKRKGKQVLRYDDMHIHVKTVQVT